MSDTSLVFNLVARDRTEQGLSSARERFDKVATGIGTSVAAALGVGVAASIDMDAANAKLAAQLGIGPQKAAELSKVAASVYSNAWGDSIGTVNEAIRGVYNNIGDVSKVEGGLEGVTTKALALAETFDQEVGPTTAAVGQLMRTGLAKDANEAFDIISQGFRTSANKADDFLDTINEYSVQFARVGLSGQTAVGLIDQAIDAGARDSDQVADALGQFGELAIGQSQSVQDAFKSIGLSSDTVAGKLKKGGKDGQAALQMTLDALRGTKDETTRLNAATALFGDPGTVMGDALFALNPAAAAASSGMDKAAGSTDRLVKTAGNSAASAIETFKRKALVQLTEVTGGFVQFAMDNQAVFQPLSYALLGVAAAVLVVRGAMAVYAAGAAVVSAASWLMETAAMRNIGAWVRMNAVGLAAYARIAAGAVASAVTTAAAWTGSALVSIGTWVLAVIRAGVVAAAQFLLMAVRAVAWATVMAAQWLIAMGPVGWVIAVIIGLTAIVIAKWDTVKRWTGVVWNWVSMMVKIAVAATIGWVMGLAAIPGMVGGYFGRMKDAAVQRAMALVAWVRGLPGRARSALGNLGGTLWNAGASLIQGFINGIMAKLGSVKNAASSVVSAARDFFPFSPAREGPFSGTGYTSYSGEALIDGFRDGILGQLPALQSTLNSLPGVAPQSVQAAPLMSGLAPALGAVAGSGGVAHVILDVRGADEEWKRLFRKIIRVDGRDGRL